MSCSCHSSYYSRLSLLVLLVFVCIASMPDVVAQSPVLVTSPGTPQSSSWQELGLLNVGRSGCKAHIIDGNRAIVIAGWGDYPGPADTSAEILDLTTGTWTLSAPMPDGFAPGAIPWTARIDSNYFLVVGGFNSFLETGDLRSYIYSVADDAWIRTGDLPAGSTLVSNFGQTNAVVLDDGRVLTASGLALGVFESNASMVFSPNYGNLRRGASGPAAGTWDFTRNESGSITSLNGASEHHKLVKLQDGRVLLIHGNDHRYDNGKWGSVYRDTHGVQAELFDPRTGKWKPVPNLPAIPGEDDRHNGVKGVRQQAAAALMNDGRVLVSGGASSPADDRGRPLLKEAYYVRTSAVLFDPDKFDRGANPWSITASMSIAREAHAMGTLPGGAGVLAVWGWTRYDANSTAEVFDPQSGAWHKVAGLPSLPDSTIPVSLPWGCTTMTASGGMIVTGGAEDLELGNTSRRTYYYRP